MRYLVVMEKGASSYGAHVPDLPGCIAAGETKEEVLTLIREAIEFHLEGLRQDGQPIPAPVSTSELVEVESACCLAAPRSCERGACSVGIRVVLV